MIVWVYGDNLPFAALQNERTPREAGFFRVIGQLLRRSDVFLYFGGLVLGGVLCGLLALGKSLALFFLRQLGPVQGFEFETHVAPPSNRVAITSVIRSGL
jgi:hypothetical protein